MRTAISGGRSYVARLVFLVMVMVLVAGGAICSQTVTMEVSPANAGTTTPSGTVSVARSSEIEIEASASAGYEFVNWTLSFPVSWSAGYSPSHNPSKFRMPAVDVTVTANFQLRGSLSLSQITIVSEPGPAIPTQQLQRERGPGHVCVVAD